MAISAMIMACAPRFGRNPSGEELARFEKSANYHDGSFHNQIDTPMFAEGATFTSTIMDSFFGAKAKNLRPTSPVAATKANLKALDPNQDAVVWLGHSSFFIILNGKRILLDPVIEDYAAPFSMFNKAFPGTTIYTPDDFPDIDLLLITHDHWDHLEYPTMRALQPRVGKAICGLGTGSHLRSWGYTPEQIVELDWNEGANLDELGIEAIPARHFSGRGLTRNKTLWTGFALTSPNRKIFISGDSGYGPHFKEAGEKFGGFDLAILEDGQYDPRWPYIHMQPEEGVAAAIDLHAKAVIPCHNGRFCIANHPWREPMERFARASKDKDFRLHLPVIGEPLNISAILEDIPPFFTVYLRKAIIATIGAV